jgi:hypothetical protein
MAKAPAKGKPARRAPARRAAAKKTRAVAPREPAESAAEPRSASAREARKQSAAERDRRFNLLLQTACLKAGSAAAVTTITGKVPLLAKLAPVLVGSVTETLALGKIHHQLVRDTLDLYDLELSELEERGVILLATAGNLGAQQLSKTMAEQIVQQLGGRYLRPIAAQVLCNLPGTGARNLGDLLRGLTGIDQRRLFSWSGEALKLALAPFRSVLSLIPGAR